MCSGHNNSAEIWRVQSRYGRAEEKCRVQRYNPISEARLFFEDQKRIIYIMNTKDALSNFQEIIPGTEKIYYLFNARNMGMV